MVVRLRHPPLFELLCHPLHDLTVFSVDHGCEIMFAGRQHDIKELSVTKLERVVGHVKLTGRNTAFEEFWEFVIETIGVRGYLSALSRSPVTCDDKMESVVAVTVSSCFSMVLIDYVDEGSLLLISLLLCKGEDGSRSSTDRR
jgi:hypothetical protein